MRIKILSDAPGIGRLCPDFFDLRACALKFCSDFFLILEHVHKIDYTEKGELPGSKCSINSFFF